MPLLKLRKSWHLRRCLASSFEICYPKLKGISKSAHSTRPTSHFSLSTNLRKPVRGASSPPPSLTLLITVAPISGHLLLFITMILSLLILNKAGGLIYHRDFTNTLNKLSSNDYLVLAGTFHGVHAITARLSPLGQAGSTGLEVMESDQFRMQCFQTLTGTKFLLLTDPQQPNVDVILRRIYELYADYVMKNPFYQIEMPVRCEAFDRHLLVYIKPKQ